ncbi:MAG: hypothetical protein Q9M36_03620 [Sulfurovum sp.]|nr:hypothetical protein [Sulfurovum sp.]
MKPDFYDQSNYSEVFDLFSSLSLFPVNNEILKILNRITDAALENNDSIKITDMGAGTGYFSSLFLIHQKKNWDNIFMNLVEPSVLMREKLEKKVIKCKNKTVLAMTAQNSLKEIANQDVFIFQRCLYAFYPQDRFEKYEEFIQQVYHKTNNGGYIVVYDFFQKYNIDIAEKYAFEDRKNWFI